VAFGLRCGRFTAVDLAFVGLAPFVFDLGDMVASTVKSSFDATARVTPILLAPGEQVDEPPAHHPPAATCTAEVLLLVWREARLHEGEVEHDLPGRIAVSATDLALLGGSVFVANDLLEPCSVP
jgi:hypothetical protein